MTRGRRVLACVLGVWMIALASSAGAQTPEEDLERARTLFAQGVEATREERWADAVERFRQVLEVRATGQVKYNLALALEHTGALREAASLLAEVAQDAQLDRRTRASARELLESIGPRLAHLTVRVGGDEAGLTITLDGEPLGIERMGQPLPLDPGTHRLAMGRGEREVASRAVTLAEGQSLQVTLVDARVAAGLEGEPVGGREPPPRSVIEEWWLWAIVGAVVVLGASITAGVVVGSEGPGPVQGNLVPGILEVTLP